MDLAGELLGKILHRLVGEAPACAVLGHCHRVVSSWREFGIALLIVCELEGGGRLGWIVILTRISRRRSELWSALSDDKLIACEFLLFKMCRKLESFDQQVSHHQLELFLGGSFGNLGRDGEAFVV